VILLVSPGSKWQLWFGVVVSASEALVYLKLEPYRNAFCGILQMATILQIMFTYITAMVFYVDLDEVSGGADLKGGELLLICNTACFGLMVGFVATHVRTSLQTLDELRAVRTVEGELVELSSPRSRGGYHLFIS
jgi:hypothetical protein